MHVCACVSVYATVWLSIHWSNYSEDCNVLYLVGQILDQIIGWSDIQQKWWNILPAQLEHDAVVK